MLNYKERERIKAWTMLTLYLTSNALGFTSSKKAKQNDNLETSIVEETPYSIDIAGNSDALELLFKVCTQKIKSIDKDVYAPFREFVNVLKNLENKDILIKYYCRYVEALIDAGYRDIVTPSTLIEKYKTYENVSYLAYEPDSIIPLEKKGNIDEHENPLSFYRIKEDGKKEEVEDWLSKDLISPENLGEYIKLMCFKYPDKIGTPEFWEHLASEYKLVNPALYKKVGVYWGTKKLMEDYTRNIEIKIGITEDGTIGFVTSRRKKGLFFTENHLKNLSNWINLKDYLKYAHWSRTIDLKEFLNPDYLKVFLQNERVLLDNVTLNESGEVEVKPNYHIILMNESKEEFANLPLSFCFTMNRNSYEWIYINMGWYIIDLPEYLISMVPVGSIPLESILNDYHILDENTLEYTFTESELIELCESYLRNQFRNEAR